MLKIEIEGNEKFIQAIADLLRCNPDFWIEYMQDNYQMTPEEAQKAYEYRTVTITVGQ